MWYSKSNLTFYNVSFAQYATTMECFPSRQQAIRQKATARPKIINSNLSQGLISIIYSTDIVRE